MHLSTFSALRRDLEQYLHCQTQANVILRRRPVLEVSVKLRGLLAHLLLSFLVSVCFPTLPLLGPGGIFYKYNSITVITGPRMVPPCDTSSFVSLWDPVQVHLPYSKMKKSVIVNKYMFADFIVFASIKEKIRSKLLWSSTKINKIIKYLSPAAKKFFSWFLLLIINFALTLWTVYTMLRYWSSCGGF